MPKITKAPIIILTTISFICQFITFVMAISMKLAYGINDSNLAQCSESQAKLFFLKIHQIVLMCAIMLVICALCNIAIFTICGFLAQDDERYGNEKKVILIILASVSVICAIVIFAYCIKAYVFCRLIYSCFESEDRIEYFYNNIIVNLIISFFIIVIQPLIFCLLDKNLQEIREIEVERHQMNQDISRQQHTNKMEENSRDELKDQETQLESSINNPKRKSIFQMRKTSPSQQQKQKRQPEENSQQILIVPDQITFTIDQSEIMNEMKKSGRKYESSNKKYKLNLVKE